MGTQIISGFIPTADGTPIRHEVTFVNTTPIATDFKTGQENVDRMWKDQQRIARNDAKWRAYVEACKRYERKLETFLERQPDRNPIRISAALNAWFRANPEPKPPVLEK